MKKYFSILTLLILTLNSWAQEPDSLFRGKLVNSELEVAIVLNLYEKNVKVPQQEIFGNVDGYLYYKHDGRKWIIVESEVQGDRALLTIINDYGSEDLTATLTYQPDGSFVLKQETGSALKIVKDRKWVKLPKKIVFKRS
jgi:hypothetical protein